LDPAYKTLLRYSIFKNRLVHFM